MAEGTQERSTGAPEAAVSIQRRQSSHALPDFSMAALQAAGCLRKLIPQRSEGLGPKDLATQNALVIRHYKRQCLKSNLNSADARARSEHALQSF